MSENVVAVRSIEIVTAEITMIRDNARKVFLESVIQIGTRLEEAKQMVPSGEWTAYLTDKLGYKPSTAQNYMRIAREFGGGQVSLTGKTAADAFGQLCMVLVQVRPPHSTLYFPALRRAWAFLPYHPRPGSPLLM